MAIEKPKRPTRTFRVRGTSEVEIPCEEIPVTASVYTLDELLARITPSNLHEEIDWGPTVGKEFW